MPFSPYSLFLPAAFAFAHLALAAALNLALAAALIFRLAFFAGFAPLTFAQRALTAARMLARPAALIFRLGLAVLAGVVLPPTNLFSSFCSSSIVSLIEAARRNCFGVRLIMLMWGIRSLIGERVKSHSNSEKGGLSYCNWLLAVSSQSRLSVEYAHTLTQIGRAIAGWRIPFRFRG